MTDGFALMLFQDSDSDSWRAEHEKPYGFALYDVRFSVELQHHFVFSDGLP